MNFAHYLRCFFHPRSPSAIRKHSAKLLLESLEERLAPAAPVFQVNASEIENGRPTTLKISTMLGDHYSDANDSKNTKPGIAITSRTSNGAWQYSVHGSTWLAVGSVSQSHALLLPASDFLRFVPPANSSGQADLLFLGWDGSLGTAGKYFDITSTGGTTPFSADAGELSMTVSPVPIWIGSGAELTPILPGVYSTSNTGSPAGDTVAAVFGRYFHDDDAAVSVGVAVTAVSGAARGVWQFSTSGGSAWTDFPTLSATNALLLSASDLVRFVPHENIVGTFSVTVLAWDGSVGTDGTAMNPKTSAAAFSTRALRAAISVNTAPTLGAVTIPPLPAATEGVITTVRVSTLLHAAEVSDPDARAFEGIAIVGDGGTDEWLGAWQYSLNNRSWANLPTVSESLALLLPSTARLRFVSRVHVDTAPAVNPTTLTYHAWDQTAGTAGKRFAVTATGGATSISGTEVTASVPVNFVNHAPTWLRNSAQLPAEQPGVTPAGSTVASVFGPYFRDAGGSSVGVAIVAVTGTTGGTWEYSTDGTTWTAFGTAKTSFGAVSSSNALLLSASDQVCFVPDADFAGTATLKAFAWDGAQGSAALPGAMRGYRIAATGGRTAFSTKLLKATVVVNAAPVLSP